MATARKSLLLLMTELTFLLVFRVNQGTGRRSFFIIIIENCWPQRTMNIHRYYPLLFVT